MATFSYDPYAESEAVKKAREQAEKTSAAYTESQNVTDARNKMNAYEQTKRADWTGGTYGSALSDTMNKINNREKFTYDVNADALYQQYKDRYMTQGRIAMQDTMGQAAALTGGYGNSYASTAGNQTYQSYLGQLNDVIPELYNLAYNRYQQEGQDLQNQLSMYGDAYNREYGEYRDTVSDWNTEMARLTDLYNTAYSTDRSAYESDRDFYNTSYNNERTWDYGLYSDAYNRALQEFQLNQSSSGGGGGGRRRSSGGSSSSATGTTDATSTATKTGTAPSINDLYAGVGSGGGSLSNVGKLLSDAAAGSVKKSTGTKSTSYRTGNMKANNTKKGTTTTTTTKKKSAINRETTR